MGISVTVAAEQESNHLEEPNGVCVVTSQAELDALIAKIRNVATLALDTEFIRDRTYFPRLCLLQIATPEAEYCIDPLSGIDIDPLLDLLYDPRILKIGHAVRQDYEIFFHRRRELPGPIFDTQIAATLCGFPDQIGYAALVQELRGIELDKAQTRTDWARRPLSSAQLVYAALDVRYLHHLQVLLRQRLDDLGRLSWLDEECARMLDREMYAIDENSLWLRVKGAFNLDLAGRRVLRALVNWREALAQEHDRPRKWLISDQDLLTLAASRPTDRTRLQSCEGISGSLISRYSDQIIALIRDANQDHSFNDVVADGIDQLPRARVKSAIEFVRSICADAGVEPQAVATRREIELVLVGQRESRLFSGWRREFIGERLSRYIDGQSVDAAAHPTTNDAAAIIPIVGTSP